MEKNIFADGFAWGEGLRWHNGYLYFSDIYGKTIYRLNADGVKETVLQLDDMPSGLGFLPDDSLLIVSGGKKQVLHLKGKEVSVYADLSEQCVGINDMVVDSHGNVYVGAYGYQMQYYKGGEADGWIFHIDINQKIHKVCEGLLSPNGIIVTDGEKQLIVADTFRKQLIAYDLNEAGTPINGLVWARLPAGPDGICYDREGCIWAALPNIAKVARIQKDGLILEEISCDETPLCCVLGRNDRKSLFIVTVPAHKELDTEDLSNPDKQCKKAASKIFIRRVSVSGAGFP